jgi:hypothetical protein
VPRLTRREPGGRATKMPGRQCNPNRAQFGSNMTDIRTAEEGRNDFYNESVIFERQGWFRFRGRDQKFFTEARKPPSCSSGDLGRRRWHHPILNFSEERDLLREVRTRVAAAKDKLFKSFHRLILKISNQYHGLRITICSLRVFSAFGRRSIASIWGETTVGLRLLRNPTFATASIRNSGIRAVKPARRAPIGGSISTAGQMRSR